MLRYHRQGREAIKDGETDVCIESMYSVLKKEKLS